MYIFNIFTFHVIKHLAFISSLKFFPSNKQVAESRNKLLKTNKYSATTVNENVMLHLLVFKNINTLHL